MCIASTRRASRPSSAAAVAAAAKCGRDSSGRPDERSSRPRSSETRAATSPSGTASWSSTAWPSSYRPCRPSARATWVSSTSRVRPSATSAASRRRCSEPAGSSKLHSEIGSVIRPSCLNLPVLRCLLGCDGHSRRRPMTAPDPGFGEFMAARWAPLYRTAYLLTGDRHEAEDLLQGALARTCARWGSIRDKGAADGYVRRAMLHAASRGWRRRDRELVTDAPPDRGHLGGLDVRADHVALWEEIRKLPPRMRATLVLRYVEDLSEAATAHELGCSVGAVKSQTHHALKRLRAALPDLQLAEEKS